MKWQSHTYSRAAATIICGMALAAGIGTPGARADEWDKKTILTVNEPIQVRDTVLQPGQYVFMLLNSDSDRHIVQIFNGDQSHIIDTILAIPAERMEPTDKTRFTFWETPPGTARAMRDWYYPGDTIGQEFPYPKHVKELAMVEPPPALVRAPETPPPAATQPAQSEPAESQAVTQAPVQHEEQPVESAENAPTPVPTPAEQTPPAQTPAQATTPPPPAESQKPQELPKTASSYPLVGLSGALLLGLAGLLRLKRPA